MRYLFKNNSRQIKRQSLLLNIALLSFGSRGEYIPLSSLDTGKELGGPYAGTTHIYIIQPRRVCGARNRRRSDAQALLDPRCNSSALDGDTLYPQRHRNDGCECRTSSCGKGTKIFRDFCWVVHCVLQ